jgi:hypothetical protein
MRLQPLNFLTGRVEPSLQAYVPGSGPALPQAHLTSCCVYAAPIPNPSPRTDGTRRWSAGALRPFLWTACGSRRRCRSSAGHGVASFQRTPTSPPQPQLEMRRGMPVWRVGLITSWRLTVEAGAATAEDLARVGTTMGMLQCGGCGSGCRPWRPERGQCGCVQVFAALFLVLAHVSAASFELELKLSVNEAILRNLHDLNNS